MKETLDRSVAPQIFPMCHLQMPGIRSMILDNGITLNIFDRGEDEVNRLTVMIDGGQAECAAPGLPELAASARLDGTSGMTGEKIAALLDYNGYWARCAASVHHQTLTFHSLNSRMEHVLPVMVELAASPVFPEHSTEVAREKAARKLATEMQRVSWHASQAINRLAMGSECAAAREITVDALRSIDVNDLRIWHNDTFAARRVNLYLAGRITPHIENMVARAFGSISAPGEGIGRVALDFQPEPDRRTVKIERPGSLQTAIRCAIPTIGRTHADYVRLRLAVMALGGYFGSRLMLNIREDKGYTYGIGAGLVGYPEGGFISIDTECDNSYTPAVLDEIHAEIRRMKDPASYTGTELERLRSYLTTSLASQLDSPFAVMDYYILQRSADTQPDYFDAQQKTLAEMTPESLADTAVRYFNEDMLYTALAGD